MTPDDPRHGTYAGGRVHRVDDEDVCEPCRRAEARYEQERQLDIAHGRPRTTGSLGTRRRIQALVALGHTFTRIAAALDVTPTAVVNLAHRQTRAFTRVTTATKINDLYEAWAMRLPPLDTGIERRNAAYARGIADKYGWAPPLAWDDIDNDLEPLGERDHAAPTRTRGGDVDPVVVRRVLDGDHVHANTAERREIVRRWLAAGRGVNDLERLTGWKPERYTPTSQEDAA